MGVRALGAFSGGLDSMIASLVLRDQGISVEAVTFHSPFFASERGRLAAEEIGIPWQQVDFTEEILTLLRDPPSGFGGCCNPCIDCHAAMFRILFGMCDSGEFDFVFSGEVLGQRPMSQNRGSLNRVARLSGGTGRLLRPLSALLLPPTSPETEGFVDRNRLLDISGRGRKRQMALADGYGVSYESPAGGCLLTEPGYSSRLRRLLERPALLTGDNALLIRHGRMFELGHGAIGLVGRSEEDNLGLEALSSPERTFVTPDVPGPSGVIIGPLEGEAVTMLCSLMALYAKAAQGATVKVSSLSGEEHRSVPTDRETAASMMVKV